MNFAKKKTSGKQCVNIKVRKCQAENLKIKNTITKLQSSQESSRTDLIKPRKDYWIEDRSFEITQEKVKKWKKKEQKNLHISKALWITSSGLICTSEESQKRKKGAENLSEEIMIENFTSIRKEMNVPIQEAQQKPGRMKLKKSTLRHN